ncbi:MAG: hypothetical protein M3M85_00795, partial [bacterium]|nr:hypothetical protein [bacterium]
VMETDGVNAGVITMVTTLATGMIPSIFQGFVIRLRSLCLIHVIIPSPVFVRDDGFSKRREALPDFARGIAASFLKKGSSS